LHVVEAPDNCRYLIMSYVWGSFQMPQMETICENGQNKVDLAPVFNKLPKTIRDAIALVQELGEQLLWIDTLCINQNDKIELNQPAAQMDKIYP
ncbi:heterokaryon incompatibility, partial [Zopfia rhizophila CBS 207.26]